MTSQWQLSGELAPREPNSVCGSWPLETFVTPRVTGRLELKLTFYISTHNIFLQCLVHLSLKTRMNIFVDDIIHIHIPLTADVISTVNNSRSVFTHKRNLKKDDRNFCPNLLALLSRPGTNQHQASRIRKHQHYRGHWGGSGGTMIHVICRRRRCLWLARQGGAHHDGATNKHAGPRGDWLRSLATPASRGGSRAPVGAVVWSCARCQPATLGTSHRTSHTGRARSARRRNLVLGTIIETGPAGKQVWTCEVRIVTEIPWWSWDGD